MIVKSSGGAVTHLYSQTLCLKDGAPEFGRILR